jgi:hypothetical protein
VDPASLEELNRRHGTDFRPAGADEGGEVGALRLVDGAGRRFVFKRQSPGPGSSRSTTTCSSTQAG